MRQAIERASVDQAVVLKGGGFGPDPRRFALVELGNAACMRDGRNDWERRYAASVAGFDARAEATKPRWVRRVEPFAFGVRAYFTVWFALALVGLGLRAVGVHVPAFIAVPVFLLSVAALYRLMRREARERRSPGAGSAPPPPK